MNPFVRKLLYKSCKTGILENDLLLSGFAQRKLTSMSTVELQNYDQMLYENDWDIFHWINGKKAIPPKYSHLIEMIQQDLFQERKKEDNPIVVRRMMKDEAQLSTQQQSHPNFKFSPSDSDSNTQPSNLKDLLQSFWQTTFTQIANEEIDFRNYQLPLARIKKIMRIEEDVKMISGEAPIIFSKACELFVLELTLRAWSITEAEKRKTLQKTDIENAALKSDLYDFLVDFIPRNVASGGSGHTASLIPETESAEECEEEEEVEEEEAFDQ